MCAAANPSRDRTGMTLVELLVVISILMLLVMVAMPAFSPTKESRQLREAARSVDLFLGASRNQALATGRPCGVLLERLAARPEACTTLYPVEEPPPYAGESVTSKVFVTHYKVASTVFTARITANVGTILPGMVRLSDRIQFNQQGPLYTITAGSTQSDGSIIPPFEAQLGRTEGELYPWYNALLLASAQRPTEASFRIYRQPMRTSGDPLELPAGTAIDLFLSRIEGQAGETGYFRLTTTYRRTSAGPADDAPVIIMFSPNGGVDMVYHALYRDASRRPILFGEPITSTVTLLVGQRGRILGLDANGTPLRPVDDLLNNGTDSTGKWFGLPNYYVTISPRTGLTAAKELAAGVGGAIAGGR